MKISEITRSFSAKKQISSYEPIEIFASVKAEVDEKDNLEEVSKKLYLMAMNSVGKDITDAEYDKWLAGKSKAIKQVQKEKEPKPF